MKVRLDQIKGLLKNANEDYDNPYPKNMEFPYNQAIDDCGDREIEIDEKELFKLLHNIKYFSSTMQGVKLISANLDKILKSCEPNN